MCRTTVQLASDNRPRELNRHPVIYPALPQGFFECIAIVEAINLPSQFTRILVSITVGDRGAHNRLCFHANSRPIERHARLECRFRR